MGYELPKKNSRYSKNLSMAYVKKTVDFIWVSGSDEALKLMRKYDDFYDTVMQAITETND